MNVRRSALQALAASSLLAAVSPASAIVGTGFIETLNATTETVTFIAPDGSGYTVTDPNQATRTSGTGDLTITPQYVRPTGATYFRHSWDIEQLFVGAPAGERYVPQFTRGGPSTWEYGMFQPTLTSPPAPAIFSGNIQPGVTSPAVGGTGDITIDSGTPYTFAIDYDATTRLLRVGMDGGSGLTFNTGTNVPARSDPLVPIFTDVVLRVAVTTETNTNRSLTINSLNLQTGVASPVPLERDIGGSVTGTWAATSTSVGTSGADAQTRQFAFWDGIISDDTSFRITGSATWAWNVTAPASAQAAMQFKLGDYFEPVPEPSTYAAAAGLLAIGFAALRRRRSA